MEFSDWLLNIAIPTEYHPLVIGFVEGLRQALDQEKPLNNKFGYGSIENWSEANALLKTNVLITSTFILEGPLLAIVGPDITYRFFAYCQEQIKYDNLKRIVCGGGEKVPTLLRNSIPKLIEGGYYFKSLEPDIEELENFYKWVLSIDDPEAIWYSFQALDDCYEKLTQIIEENNLKNASKALTSFKEQINKYGTDTIPH